ncbi:uncharacterized protein MYCGRDRAFT_87205 [Zymoseptoria tritici IPO323]|uniref:AvrStb6 n=1 Tax=Zymoseptoria tritici (strain CBS 115943 / IPO323) TaxID=336722 RepID=F9XI67_ZYMTI|nr:uncharacterized protein MYCGRDRAFT_87205 [Zymoseptoria tritici IPO323]EGP85049.1 hypothetical protein MYCGRDRAFT_87205 [Zymoseptoria tritici IPO323]
MKLSINFICLMAATFFAGQVSAQCKPRGFCCGGDPAEVCGSCCSGLFCSGGSCIS